MKHDNCSIIKTSLKENTAQWNETQRMVGRGMCQKAYCFLIWVIEAQQCNPRQWTVCTYDKHTWTGYRLMHLFCRRTIHGQTKWIRGILDHIKARNGDLLSFIWCGLALHVQSIQIHRPTTSIYWHHCLTLFRQLTRRHATVGEPKGTTLIYLPPQCWGDATLKSYTGQLAMHRVTTCLNHIQESWQGTEWQPVCLNHYWRCTSTTTPTCVPKVLHSLTMCVLAFTW